MEAAQSYLELREEINECFRQPRLLDRTAKAEATGRVSSSWPRQITVWDLSTSDR